MQIHEKFLALFIYRIIRRSCFFKTFFFFNELSPLETPARISKPLASTIGHVESESHKRIFHGRHARLEAWRPLSIPGSWNCTNSDGRSGVRLDKRNFEGHRTRLSADRRSLRAPDRFDARLRLRAYRRIARGK